MPQQFSQRKNETAPAPDLHFTIADIVFAAQVVESLSIMSPFRIAEIANMPKLSDSDSDSVVRPKNCFNDFQGPMVLDGGAGAEEAGEELKLQARRTQGALIATSLALAVAISPALRRMYSGGIKGMTLNQALLAHPTLFGLTWVSALAHP